MARFDDVGDPASAVDEREQRLRRFITEMFGLTAALTARMQFAGYARARDGVFACAIALRDRLAAEMGDPGLPERPSTEQSSDQLPLRFTG